jgi:hypothetical protein
VCAAVSIVLIFFRADLCHTGIFLLCKKVYSEIIIEKNLYFSLNFDFDL